MASPRQVIDLIERFTRNREVYLSSEYNEAQVRLELINPFFKALGWDMYNEAGYAKAYKDVVHEDAIKIGGATKAPDYAFRIGGARKFFVEAMFKVHKQLGTEKTRHKKTSIERQTTATDKQIGQEKKLGFRSPYEVFFSTHTPLRVALGGSVQGRLQRQKWLVSF